MVSDALKDKRDKREETSLEDFDSILGTPSAQKLFKLLVCWDKLSVKELIKLMQISETQIYNVLKNLEKIDLIEKKSRGIYGLTDKKFTILLKEAYSENLKEFLGKELQNLTNLVETKTKQSIESFSHLIETWKPFLKEHFTYKLSTLGAYMLDEVIQ